MNVGVMDLCNAVTALGNSL